MNQLVQRYWDVSGSLQSAFGTRFEFYANSRADWTTEQRRRIRSILIFAANSLMEDSFSPHVSMMAGQPNFVFDPAVLLSRLSHRIPHGRQSLPLLPMVGQITVDQAQRPSITTELQSC
jgi:hypothetical protein